MKKKIPEVYTFGMGSLENRIKTLKSRAKAAKKHSETIMKAAMLEKAASIKRYEKYSKLEEDLCTEYNRIKKESAKLRAEGKERLDGKRAAALIKRGLGETCGVEKRRTLLSCTNDTLELREMYWAHKWVVSLMQDMASQLSMTEMSKFYNIIEEFKGDPEAILAEGGMLVLGKQ